MSDVVSFRPTAEEKRLIERTRRRLGLKSRSEAVRHLMQLGSRNEPDDPTERLLVWRVPNHLRSASRSVTSEEIDEVVYADDVWRPRDR